MTAPGAAVPPAPPAPTPTPTHHPFLSTLSSHLNFTRPFGLQALNTLNADMVASAAPLRADWRVWAAYIVIPTMPLLAQAYLVLKPGTRGMRAALMVMSVTMLWQAWGAWRVHEPNLNAFNCGLTVVFLHLTVKSIEFGLLREPIRDPWTAYRRPRLVSAMDLVINSRLVSLGAVGLDKYGRPNRSVRGIHLERQLPPVGKGTRPRTRLGAVGRHALHAAVHYLVLDTFFSLLRTVGAPMHTGGPHTLHRFIHDQHITFLPHVLAWDVAPWATAAAVKAGVLIAIWQALSFGYHATATVCLASGLWEVRSWDVDLFDNPFNADSMIDFWGRRWHQLFRHQFIILSSTLLTLLRLPINSFTLFPLTFTFSAALHVLGTVSMTPIPGPWGLGGFFLVCGVACAAETAFKRITHKRVAGWLGRVWFLAVMLAAGRLLTDSFLDAGMAGNDITPPGGPGVFVAKWLTSWAFRVEE